MLFNLVSAKNIVLLCFFFFSLMINLYFLILATIAGIFSPIVEIIIPIKISTKEAKTEIEIHPVTAETEVRMCSL